MASEQAEVRDALRDLCVVIAELAAACVQLIGTTHAQQVIEQCGRVCARMDELDAQEAER